MDRSEFAAARNEMGFTPERMAGHLGVVVEDVLNWEAGLQVVPAFTARQVDWLLLMHRRDEAMKASGLPECEWLNAFHAKDPPEHKDAATSRLEAFFAHIEKCPTCEARDRYARKNLGPPPPAPGTGILGHLVARIDALPKWAQPAVFGAAFLFGIVALRMVFAIPALVRGDTRFSELLLALFAAAAGGALGGLGYTFMGKPLRAVPIAGPYLAGIVTVACYVFGIALVAQYAFGERLIKDATDAVVFGVGAVFFGLVFGHSAFRETSPTEAGATQ